MRIWRASLIILAMAVQFVAASSEARAATSYFGAPYYTQGYGVDSSQPFQSVSEAETAWRQGYITDLWDRLFWQVGPFYDYEHFTTKYYDPTTNNGIAAGFLVDGYTAGGNPAYATAYSYAPSKNLGGGCSNHTNNETHCGNPINTATGNKFQIETDIKDSDLLEFTRYYNSELSAPTHLLGLHWSNTYTRKVEYLLSTNTTPTAAIVSRPDGNRITFTLVSGIWQADADVVSTLVRHDGTSGELLGWTFTPDDGRQVEEYDTLGRLTQVTRNDGKSITLTYNNGVVEGNSDDFRLTLVQAQDGRSLTFAYDSSGRISRIIDPSGSSYGYNYDAAGCLVTVTYPGGAQRGYSYNEPAYTNGTNLPTALTGITTEDGQRFATFNYAADGRAISTEHAGAVNKFAVQYNTDGSASITTPLGETQQRVFAIPLGVKKAASIVEQCSGCISRTTSYTYDANGNRNLVTDASGTITAYNYNARNLLTQQIDSANQSATERTIQNDWDTTFRVPTERRTYDASGALVSKTDWTYNARGQALTQTQIDPVTLATRTTTSTYCEQADITAATCPLLGLLKSVDGPRTDVTDVTNYTYYATDDSTCTTAPTTCPHRKGDLWKLTDALGHVTQYLKDDGAGRVLSIQDPNGVLTDLTYSPRGWLTQRAVRGAVAADDRITTFAYDAVGQVIQVTQPDNSYVAFTYDAAHRLTDIRDALSNSIHFTLDNAGNRTKEDTKVASQVLVRTLSRVYDGMGLLQQSLNAQNAATAYTYDANNNPKLTTDALGRVAQQDYDPLNRLMHTLQNVGGIGASTTYAYDARDHLTQVTDPKGLNTVYQYDGLDNLTKLTSPDTGITTYTYDTAGNRKTQTDARPITATYTYDSLNRVTGITFPGGIYRTFTYDVTQMGCAAGETFSVGRLTQFFNVMGTTTRLCYDRFGNLVRKQQQIMQAKSFTTRYVYDKAGRVLQIITPTSTAITYTRDAAGRILTLAYRLAGQTVDTPVISNVTYYPFGPVQQLTYANGRTLTRTYDQDYVIASVLSNNGPGGLDYSFGRDAVGNLTQLLSATASNNFSYDGLDRLTGVSDLSNTLIAAYAYDGTGNRLSKQTPGGTQTYTYPSTSHRLSAVAGTARTYDAVGNTTGIGTRSFIYQETDRLANVRNSGVLVKHYAYNALGERVSKSLNGVTDTFYMYDESGHLLGDYDATAARLHDYLWLDDLPVGVLSGATGTVAYLEPDHLNTPRVAVDPVRNVAIWKWPLGNDAFGESAPQQDPDGDGTQFVLNLRLPGQYFDAESGLSYNYFRDYDPTTGRYTESDPFGLIAGTSTYAYVGGNPISFADPLGLLWQFPQWAVDAAAGLGDGVSFGLTDMARDAMGTNDVVNHCSGSYRASHLAGTALPVGAGLGRLAYAGAARAIPFVVDASESEVAQALEGSAMRNGLKQIFRGDFSGTSTFRMYDPSSLLANTYNGDAAEMLAAAARTDTGLNALGATAVAGGVGNEANASNNCGCSK